MKVNCAKCRGKFKKHKLFTLTLKDKTVSVCKNCLQECIEIGIDHVDEQKTALRKENDSLHHDLKLATNTMKSCEGALRSQAQALGLASADIQEDKENRKWMR